MTERLGRHIVLGMAGHIDHGKTEIVKALTGTDTDRLKEEKERGMTTDLGFAFLGEDITIIDVPGHEKFVKTMVAGVNTVDLSLLVIAADDGVMPQTIEHLEILNLLNIQTGLVAVSKIDLVEEDWLSMVVEDVKRLLRGTVLQDASIIPVSPITGQGMDRLKESIFEVARTVQDRRDKGIFRLPIDRVFTIKGFGTVVAGTVLSGKIATDDTVELLPQGKTLRVRGVQVHDHPVQESSVGYRTAINLMNVEKEAVQRGDMLAEPGFLRPTSMMDVHFSLLKTWKKELKNRTRVRVHIGTNEVIARIILLDREAYAPGDEGFVQLHFEKPVVADREDRYVVRSYSPIRTMGGGFILDTYPSKHKRFEKDVIQKLQRLLKGDPSLAVLDVLETSWFTPMLSEDLAKSLGITKEDTLAHLTRLESAGDALRVGKKRWMSRKNHDILKRKLEQILATFHQENPLRLFMSGAELRSRIRQPVDRNLFEEIIQQLQEEKAVSVKGDRIQRKGHTARLTPEIQTLKNKIEKTLLSDPFNPPSEKQMVQELGEEVESLLKHMTESGDLIRLEAGLFLHKKAVEDASCKIRTYLQENARATVSDLKQCLGTTRKYAVPLLVHFDTTGLTERDGDYRRLKK